MATRNELLAVLLKDHKSLEELVGKNDFLKQLTTRSVEKVHKIYTPHEIFGKLLH